MDISDILKNKFIHFQMFKTIMKDKCLKNKNLNLKFVKIQFIKKLLFNYFLMVVILFKTLIIVNFSINSNINTI